MKRRVCCLLLGICMLCLPAQQVYAAPLGPAAHEEEKNEEKIKPHEKEHEKPEPPKPGEKPVPPHEKEHPKPHEVKKPHEEKKGPLGGEKPEPPKPEEKPIPPHEKEKQEIQEEQPVNTPTVKPTTTPTITAAPAITSTPTSIPTPTATPTVIQTTTSSNTTSGSEVAKYALQFVGNPYKWGGTSLTNGADCSGFVQSVYAHFGCKLFRTSREQAYCAGYMEVVPTESNLEPGDLVFYANSAGSVYHVALYIGNGKVVHAANANLGIIISEYTYMKPYKARRIIR